MPFIKDSEQLISNVRLTIEDVYSALADDNKLWKFAHSFDGYAYFEKESLSPRNAAKTATIFEMENRRRFINENLLPNTLTDLRICLFVHARRFRFTSQDPQLENFRDTWVNKLLEEMSQKIKNNELE